MTFLKLTQRHDQKLFLFRCDRCAEEHWHTIDLPEHLRMHDRRNHFGNRCGGGLVKIAEGYAHHDDAAVAARKACRVRKDGDR